MLRKVINSLKFKVLSFNFVLLITSALLLILTYPKFNLEFLAWIALIPLFFSLENKNIKQRFVIGYVFGLFFFSGILYWLANVTIPGTITLVLLLSFIPAIFSSLYAIRYTLYAILTIPSAWVITEYLRTYLLSGFPWALLGHSQYLNLPLIQFADITGVYGISFLIVLVNVCIYAVIKNFPKKIIYTVFALFVFIVVLFYGFYRLKQKYITTPVSIAIIQGNIPQDKKWDPKYDEFILNRYLSLTLETKKERPDLIIWPETSLPDLLEKEKYSTRRLRSLARSMDTNLLIGAIREKDFKLYNSAALISRNGEIVKSYDKIHLVPFGEYVPFEKYIPWFRDMIDKPIGDFESGSEFTLFNISKEESLLLDSAIIRNSRFYKFGALICFEDIFPALSRTYVKRGAQFLINITNDAWFGKTSAPYQHVQSSVFRAVENRVPVIRSANTGVSCFIDQKGKIYGEIRKDGNEIYVEGFKQRDIYPLTKPTFYSRFGDLFSYICFGLYLISFIKIRRKELK